MEEPPGRIHNKDVETMSGYDLIKELLQEIERLKEELAQYQRQENKN